MMKFEATFGVVAGYGHDNEGVAADPAAIVARAWRAALEAEMTASGILVGAVICAGRVVYPTDFGCPEAGEIVATVRGDANPKFVPSEKLGAFRNAVIRVADATRIALQQERVQLSFTDNCGFVYFEPADFGGMQKWGC